jgi:hypothetical protein
MAEMPAAEVDDRAGRRRIRLVREAQSKKNLDGGCRECVGPVDALV